MNSAPRDMGRALVVAGIFALFAAAYLCAWLSHDHDALTGFNGAILTAFAGGWGYYLGSSKGSADSGAALREIATQPPPPVPRPDLDIPAKPEG